MNNAKLPTNYLHVREAIEELRRKSFLEANEVYHLPTDIVDYDHSIFGLQNSSLLMMYSRTKAIQAYAAHTYLCRYVGIIFMAEPDNFLQADGRVAQIGQYKAIITFGMEEARILRQVGKRVRNIAVILEPEALIEEYGLEYANLPPYVRIALASKSKSQARIIVHLSPRCRIILEDIFNRHLQGITHRRYIIAKTVELVCEIVDYLNSIGLRKKMSSGFAKKELFRQRIECAAQIYKVQIGSMPSVESISKAVGLNRNLLTDGFKEIYGLSPGQFGRIARLEWAKEQIESGIYSPGEVSILTGYQSLSAFSRAYIAEFGSRPMSDMISARKFIIKSTFESE